MDILADLKELASAYERGDDAKMALLLSRYVKVKPYYGNVLSRLMAWVWFALWFFTVLFWFTLVWSANGY